MTADVVVAGAGHNSLICAAYLAQAGREVVVLDARPVPGGGAVTEELLGPGYAIDSCSTGQTLIQTNPLPGSGALVYSIVYGRQQRSWTLPRGGSGQLTDALVRVVEALVDGCRAVRDGRYVRDTPWLLVGTPTLVDPSRAPTGRHTVKLISPQCYAAPPGAPSWEAVKEEHARHQLDELRRVCPDFGGDVILASLVRSPVDVEAANPHMIQGTFHGGDRGLPFSGALRPAPGWAQHRMPIPGLYQTGGTTHPGGSITGGPGRNAAAVVLQDLQTTIEEVVAGAGRARALGR